MNHPSTWKLRGLVLGTALCLGANLAVAQEQSGLGLDQFHPAPAGDRFFGVQGGDPGGHMTPRIQLLGDYAYRPLVLYNEGTDDELGPVVDHQLFLHVGASLGLWNRLNLSVNMPFALATSGDSPTVGGAAFDSPSGAALGDLRFGARLRLFGEWTSPVSLGIGGYLWVPTGDPDKFAGSDSVRGLPAVVLSGEVGSFVYAVNAGVLLQKRTELAYSAVANQLYYGAAAGVLLVDKRLQIGPEAYGSIGVGNGTTLDRETNNLEAILGLKLRVGSFVLGAGAGPGITDGLGTPALRAVASVAFAPIPEKAEDDRDHDGILDKEDACPDDAGEPDPDPELNGCPDTDGDTIRDPKDACPEVKGEPNDDPEKNGCPPDTDGDGILDKDDACPDVKGVKDDDPEKNGCPPDRDGDGILDEDDACPDIKGVKSDDPEENGCPPDTDGDGIRDDKDACPKEKGQPDPDPEKNGCPSLVRVSDKEIVILQQVQFKTASADILPASDELLQQVANVLREHSEILEIEVQGHTDNRGQAGYNKKLSQRRAASVVKWLTTKGGIEESRLVSQGYGMESPIADNDTDEGRQKNRRVEFKIQKTEPKKSTDTE